jgi:hypothetical protein
MSENINNINDIILYKIFNNELINNTKDKKNNITKIKNIIISYNNIKRKLINNEKIEIELRFNNKNDDKDVYIDIDKILSNQLHNKEIIKKEIIKKEITTYKNNNTRKIMRKYKQEKVKGDINIINMDIEEIKNMLNKPIKNNKYKYEIKTKNTPIYLYDNNIRIGLDIEEEIEEINEKENIKQDVKNIIQTIYYTKDNYIYDLRIILINNKIIYNIEIEYIGEEININKVLIEIIKKSIQINNILYKTEIYITTTEYNNIYKDMKNITNKNITNMFNKPKNIEIKDIIGENMIDKYIITGKADGLRKILYINNNNI